MIKIKIKKIKKLLADMLRYLKSNKRSKTVINEAILPEILLILPIPNIDTNM